MNTSQDALRGAWEALLRGDTKERDRLCERGNRLLQADDEAAAVQKLLSVDFYVRPNGTAYSSRLLAKTAGALQ